MLTKTKKILFLTSGLVGGLLASSAAGLVLSSCTVETVNGGNSNSSGSITLPDTWYSKDINWTDSTSLNSLIIDDQGIVYSNKYMTEIIAILPGYGGGTIVIPSTVTSITGYNNVTTVDSTTTKTPTGAFEGLTSLVTVTFAGSKTTTIGARAFYGCTALQKITLPSSVTLIDTNAFYGCTYLNSINLNNIQYIGQNAFNGAMTYIPSGSISLNLSSVVTISAGAFQNATGIGSVDFSKNSTITTIAENAFNGCTSLSGDIDLSNATSLMTLGNRTTPTTNSTYGSSFSGTAITNFYLPTNSSLRTIAYQTFYNCKNLVNVCAKGQSGFVAPATITTIAPEAFSGASSITSVDISAITATSPLQARCFIYMTGLTSVNLGTTITSIPNYAFGHCTALTSLTLPASITNIATGTYTGSAGTLVATTYPPFYASGLTTIDLSAITSYSTTEGQATVVPAVLFYGCTALETIILKEGTTGINEFAFYNTSALKTVYASGDTASNSFKAPSTLASIGQGAFYNSGITSVDLSSMSSTYTSVATSTFSNCSSLESITLPSSITQIVSGAFQNCYSLSSVNFNALTSLTSIGNYNFNSSSLSSIDLSNTKLTSLTIAGTTVPYLFADLNTQPTVQLPPTLWNVSDLSIFSYTSRDESTGTVTRTTLPFSFPKGFNPSSSSISTSMPNGQLINHTMFARISGNLDLSSFSTLKSISRRTFFSNSNLTDLTFNASSFATSNNLNSLQFIVQNGNSTDTGSDSNGDTFANNLTYSQYSLPFGSNSGLNTINFNNFSTVSSNSDSSVTDVFESTTVSTWRQVKTILNSFAKIEVSDSITSWDNAYNNLAEWPEDGNGYIDGDLSLVVGYIADADNSDINSHNFESVAISYLANENSLSINSSTTSTTFTHNGITWTFTKDSNQITITGTGINTYRGVFPSSTSALALDDSGVSAQTAGTAGKDYQVFFNTKDITIDTDDSGSRASTTYQAPNSDITVTLTISLPTTSSR